MIITQFDNYLPGWQSNLSRGGGMADLPTGRQAHRTRIMYYVYAIQSINRNYIYIGLTNNIERRFIQHQSGKERTTSPYKPYKLILIEEFENRIDARKREKYLKSGCGKEWIKANN